MIKKYKIIALIGIAAIVLYFCFQVLYGLFGFSKDIKEVLPSTYVLTPTDSALFASNISKLKVHEIKHSTQRLPISLLYFDNKYAIIRYQIPLHAQKNALRSLIHFRQKNLKRSDGYSYQIAFINDIESQTRAGKRIPPSEIYLTIAGDSLSTTLQNDSLLSFHVALSNLSIRYSENDPIDIHLGQRESSDSSVKISADILFLTRNNCLHLLVMTPNNPDALIDPSLLYKLVGGN